MTWSMTLAEPPRAGADSKPHHCKQKVHKTKDIRKTWVLKGKQFEDSRRKKNSNIIFDLSKNPSGTPQA